MSQVEYASCFQTLEIGLIMYGHVISAFRPTFKLHGGENTLLLSVAVGRC